MAHIVGEIDHTGKVWKPVQPAPVQEPTAGRVKELADRYGLDASMIGALHKDMLREIDRLEYANAELLRAISKTVQENLHLADGDNCTLVHLVRALGPDDPGREAPLTREELRSMWIKRKTGWDFYVNVDARLFGEGKAIDKLTGLDGKVASEAIDCLENPKWFGWPKMETYTSRRNGIEVRFRNKEDHDKFFANLEGFDLMLQNKTIF
jgi:hypothetical protein